MATAGKGHERFSCFVFEARSHFQQVDEDCSKCIGKWLWRRFEAWQLGRSVHFQEVKPVAK
jgi:hypothetical protein